MAAALPGLALAAIPAPAALAAPAVQGRPATAPAQGSRLLYAEPLGVRSEGAAARQSAGAAPPRRTLYFRAFGRDFQLEMAPNVQLGPAPPGVQPEAGAIPGMPGSWVRLTREGGNLTGLIFDGSEYFGVEPVASLVTVLEPDVPQPADGNMIYRLSDLLIDPQAMSCTTAEAGAGPGDGGQPASAATALRALGAELAAAAATGPGYRVHIAPVADYEFASRFGSSAGTEMIARLNIADGIFRSQAGVNLAADAPVIFTSTSPPYPLTAGDAYTLLGQISDYRRNSNTSAGITHLFSNKTFANLTVGLAWQDAMCYPREGAGLSTSAGLTTVMSGLVAAHEIGHNFGAPHDGESPGPCASTPETYLMAPVISGSSDFSPCSLGRIALTLQSRLARFPACISTVANFDVAVLPPSAASTQPGVEADLLIRVQNQGNQPASTLGLQLQVPAALQVTGADTVSGSCSINAGEVGCALADLAVAASWDVHLRVRGSTPGSYTLNASVSAAVDDSPGNNQQGFTLTVINPAAAAGGGGGESGGGGGATDVLALLGLLALALRRRAGAGLPAV
ncbi:MAG: GlyGly-CTERM sorting domain-containing protein [Gammaproteobacteria bacterium]|nr:GlyGly-CTERM sorting domain-containing protein [Gammaproteobacteria bacterium]